MNIHELGATLSGVAHERNALLGDMIDLRRDVLDDAIHRIDHKRRTDPSFTLLDALRLLNTMWMETIPTPADPGPTSPGPGSAGLRDSIARVRALAAPKTDSEAKYRSVNLARTVTVGQILVALDGVA